MDFASDPLGSVLAPLDSVLGPLVFALDPLDPVGELTRFSAGTVPFMAGTGPTGARIELSGCRKG